jgi:23S rRNA (guanosine2251-2'-O)-methyltransferase
MIKENIRFESSTVFEGMTSIRAIIKAIDSGLGDRRITEVIYDKDKYTKIAKELGYIKAVSDKYGYKVVESTAEEIDKLTLGNSHGGIICIATDRKIPRLSDSVVLPRENGFYCMIEGIEDPYNFGYSLRSLYACGCDGIILPERNWMSAAGVVARSSAGASELFPIFTSDSLSAAQYFKARGYSVVCADEKTDNLLGKCELKLPLLLIVGGEKRGISKKLLELADVKVKIDYAREFRASLSAASATTMFAYEIMRQNSK